MGEEGGDQIESKTSLRSRIIETKTTSWGKRTRKRKKRKKEDIIFMIERNVGGKRRVPLKVWLEESNIAFFDFGMAKSKQISSWGVPLK